MRITGVSTFKAWVDWCGWLLVRVETDEGLVGWGEGSLHGAILSVEEHIRELAEHLVGQDPAGPERHWQRMYHAWRWRGGATAMTALAALDIALWDIEGKRLGVPVARLLGGPHRTRLPVYASHWLSGVRTPDAAHAGARDARRRGFRGFKFIPVTYESLHADESGAIRTAAALMEAARDGAGEDCDIHVECSEFLSPRTAILLEAALRPFRPAWLEEPIPYENAAAMVALQRAIQTPIATGERLLSRWEVRELLEQGGCRVLQPDLMHAGGITECRRIASYADTHYVPIAPHNPAGPICNAASMHLAAAVPNFLVLEQMEDQRAARDACSVNPVQLQDGHFILPDAPGLGVEPDLEALAAYPWKPQPRRERVGTIWR